MSEIFTWTPVVLLAATSVALFLSQRWRISIIALSLQYLAVFLLLFPLLPLGLAAVKLVVGWMSGALLGASHPEGEDLEVSHETRAWIVFRVSSIVLVSIGLLAIYPGLESWLAVPDPVRLAGLTLMAMGLLQLGMSTRPLRATLGLLTLLTGFEVLYGVLEQSVLVAGLLAGVQLGVALVGAYLLGADGQEVPA